MMLETVYYGNTLQAWLSAAVLCAGAFLALILVRRIAVRRIGKVAERTTNVVDDLVVQILKKTRSFFLAGLSLYAGAGTLTLSPGFGHGLRVLLVVVAFAQAGIWGNAIIAFLLGKAVREREGTDAAGATTLAALGLVARIVLFSILLLIGLDNLGINVTGLVAGLGIGGIAVALAVQNVLGDLFASLSIALDKPFVIGDFVVVGDHLGSIEHIGLKTTRVRSLSGEQIVFSNADLLNSRIRNYKRMQERRALFTIGVTYQTTLEQLSAIPEILAGIIRARTDTRFDRAHFKEYGDSALIFEVVYYILSPEYNTYMDIQQAVNLAVFERFRDEGIEFAYPTQTLYLEGTTVRPEVPAARLR